MDVCANTAKRQNYRFKKVKCSTPYLVQFCYKVMWEQGYLSLYYGGPEGLRQDIVQGTILIRDCWRNYQDKNIIMYDLFLKQYLQHNFRDS